MTENHDEEHPVPTWQENWRDLVLARGEAAARSHVAAQLRAAADQVDAGGYPGVFGCLVPDSGLLDGGFIATIGVILSDPWPG